MLGDLIAGGTTEWSGAATEAQRVEDRHLNLFYTYNRDSELVENNLTRAFVVSLSIVPGETRHNILSSLLEKSRRTGRDPANADKLNFTHARFALQSHVDRYLPKNAGTKLLLTISTEPLDAAPGLALTDEASADEIGNGGGSTSVPDAWVYSNTRAYCILIEAKVGSYPLDGGQLRSHANDWFGLSLETLSSNGSLCSVTWVDVLESLREALSDRSSSGPSEKALLSHLMEFLGYYGYRLFEGFDFGGLRVPPDLTIRNLPSSERGALNLGFDRLAMPPDFALVGSSPSSRGRSTR